MNCWAQIKDSNPGSNPVIPGSNPRSKFQVHTIASAPVPWGSPKHLILGLFFDQSQKAKSVLFFSVQPGYGTGSVLLLLQTDQTIVVKSPSFETPPLRAESSVGKGRWPCSCWYLFSSRHACALSINQSTKLLSMSLGLIRGVNGQ